MKRILFLFIIFLVSCRSVDSVQEFRGSYLGRPRTSICWRKWAEMQQFRSIDTVVLRDSIFIREMQKGDTVYLTRTEYRDRWRIQIQRDTIIDTQYVEQIIEKPPERYIPRFYKISTAILYILIALIIVFIVIKIRLR